MQKPRTKYPDVYTEFPVVVTHCVWQKNLTPLRYWLRAEDIVFDHRGDHGEVVYRVVGSPPFPAWRDNNAERFQTDADYQDADGNWKDADTIQEIWEYKRTHPDIVEGTVQLVEILVFERHYTADSWVVFRWQYSMDEPGDVVPTLMVYNLAQETFHFTDAHPLWSLIRADFDDETANHCDQNFFAYRYWLDGEGAESEAQMREDWAYRDRVVTTDPPKS